MHSYKSFYIFFENKVEYKQPSKTKTFSKESKLPIMVAKWQPTPVFLSGESHGQRSLAGYSPQGCKESDTTERLHTHTHKIGNSVLCRKNRSNTVTERGNEIFIPVMTSYW